MAKSNEIGFLKTYDKCNVEIAIINQGQNTSLSGKQTISLVVTS